MPPWMHPDQKNFSGEGQEEFLKFLGGHRGLLPVFPALLKAGCHHLEPGTIEGFGYCSKLGDDVTATAVLLDHVDHAIKLATGALKAHEDVAADSGIYFHGHRIPQYPVGYRILHGT